MMSRLAVLLAVCQLGFCCGDAQCSAALGSCHSPQASLMQVKSMGQKGKVTAGTDTRSETLSGFQRYADELVNQYLKTGETLSDDVKEAINTIIAFIDHMYIDLLLFHNQDVNESQSFKGKADACKTTYWDDDFVTGLNALKARRDAAGQLHLTCRDWLYNNCPGQSFNPDDWSAGQDHLEFTAADADHGALFGVALIQKAGVSVPPQDIDHCQVYDDYRQHNSAALLSSAPQNCAPAHLGDDYIKAEDEAVLKQMEECLEHVKTWLDPLYELMEACERQTENCRDTKPKECMNNQSAFEFETCEYNTMLGIKCSGYGACFDGVLTDSSEKCATIQIRADARQADNETGERIKCLLGVLMVDDNATKVEEEGTVSKADKLAACKSTSYDVYNAAWEITCPDWGDGGEPTPEYPAGIDCMDTRLSPCDDAFLTEEYYTKASWMQPWQEDRPPTALNLQVGQCKACFAPVGN